jgi:hypothetical protein
MNTGELVWFCWWKGHYPHAGVGLDLVRKPALILGEYEGLDNSIELWYDIYIFEDNRRIIVDKIKLEPIKEKKKDVTEKKT